GQLAQVVHAGLATLGFPVAHRAALHPQLGGHLGLGKTGAAACDADAMGGCAVQFGASLVILARLSIIASTCLGMIAKCRVSVARMALQHASGMKSYQN